MSKRKRDSSTTTTGDDEEKSARMMKKSMKIHKSRTDCLKKKTYELSVLCGVDVAFLSFAPDGSISTWPENQTEIVPLIQRYKHTDFNHRKKTRSGLSDLKPNKKKLGFSNNTVTDFGKSFDFSLNPETTNDQVDVYGEEVCALLSQYQFLESREKEVETLRQRCWMNLINQGFSGSDDQDRDLISYFVDDGDQGNQKEIITDKFQMGNCDFLHSSPNTNIEDVDSYFDNLVSSLFEEEEEKESVHNIEDVDSYFDNLVSSLFEEEEEEEEKESVHNNQDVDSYFDNLVLSLFEEEEEKESVHNIEDVDSYTDNLVSILFEEEEENVHNIEDVESYFDNLVSILSAS